MSKSVNTITKHNTLSRQFSSCIPELSTIYALRSLGPLGMACVAFGYGLSTDKSIMPQRAVGFKTKIFYHIETHSDVVVL